MLRSEHPEMQAATAALRARLASTPVRSDDAVAEARHAVEHVWRSSSAIAERGADLLWEAYSLDTGGGE